MHACVTLVGSDLVKLSIREMIKGGCEEVTLEAEATNYGALSLYRNLGFIRDKRLSRYTEGKVVGRRRCDAMRWFVIPCRPACRLMPLVSAWADL